MNKQKLYAAIILVAALGSIFPAGCKRATQPTPPPPSAGSALLVADFNGGAGSVTIVDITTGAVRMAAAGLGNTPNAILRSGDKIFVINSGSNDMNVLSISNQNVLTSLDTVDLGVQNGLSPQFGAIAGNRRMYISNFNQSTVTVLDTATMQPLAYLIVGHSPEDVVAVGHQVFVCNSGYDGQLNPPYRAGTISVISTDVDIGAVVGTIPVGMNPYYVAVDDSRNLYVVCTGDYSTVFGKIYKISAQTDSVMQVINLGGSPTDIAITSSGFGYVCAQDDSLHRGQVYRFETSTGNILNGPNGDHPPIYVSSGASRIVVASDNSVYVACWTAGKVDHIVGDSRAESYTVGDGPGAMLLIER